MQYSEVTDCVFRLQVTTTEAIQPMVTQPNQREAFEVITTKVETGS